MSSSSPPSKKVRLAAEAPPRRWRRRPRTACCHCGLHAWTALGLGSGDRFGEFRGGSGSLKGRVQRGEKPGELQGKRSTKRTCEIAWLGSESSMVRRGSTVRVRQRALKTPRKSRLVLSKPLAGAPVCGGYGAGYGALRSETRRRSRARCGGRRDGRGPRADGAERVGRTRWRSCRRPPCVRRAGRRVERSSFRRSRLDRPRPRAWRSLQPSARDFARPTARSRRGPGRRI